MCLEEDEIQIVQATFEMIAPLPALFTELFFLRLFELNPQLAAQWDDDMLSARSKTFMTAIAESIRALKPPDPAEIDYPAPSAQSRRMYIAPVRDITCEEALLWTLEQALGLTFDEDVATAWKKTYPLIEEDLIGTIYFD